MGPKNMNFAPSGNNNGDKYGISDVNKREYRDRVMQERRAEYAKQLQENSETQIDNNKSPFSAREQYYNEQHDARVAQLAQFRMNNFKDSNGESVDRGEKDRKLELRHQFDQIKLETDTFLKMQAGLGLMSEKEIREYKDNLNRQENNALEYMRDGGGR